MSSKSGDGFNPIGVRRPGGRDGPRGRHVGPGAAVSGRTGWCARCWRSHALGSDARRRLHDERDPPPERARRSSTSSARSPSARSHERTNALANAWLDAGLGEGDGVAIMCRNHRGFIEATVAASKIGAHALYLNTAFAGPQLTEVVQREKPTAIVYDQEFTELLEDAGKRRKRFVAWVDDDSPPDPTLEELIESRRHRGARAARRARPRRDPHLGHDRHAEGRVAQAARRRSARRSRCCRGSR